jgi:hypothetical protein
MLSDIIAGEEYHMKLVLRLFIVLILIAGIALLAGENAAWAGPAQANDPVGQAVVSNEPALHKDDPGSVKPPPPFVLICKEGVKSVGGVVTLEVKNLAEGYCIIASLRNPAYGLGQFPKDAGKPLAHFTILRVFYHGRLVNDLPTEDGQARLCYAVPPGKTGKLYFHDFYGSRFGRHGKNDWVPLDTTVDNGIACAASQETGAYALMGK